MRNINEKKTTRRRTLSQDLDIVGVNRLYDSMIKKIQDDDERKKKIEGGGTLTYLATTAGCLVHFMSSKPTASHLQRNLAKATSVQGENATFLSVNLIGNHCLNIVPILLVVCHNCRSNHSLSPFFVGWDTSLGGVSSTRAVAASH